MKRIMKVEGARNIEKESFFPMVIGLGGLSEGGKSTAGVFLEQQLGIKRMKIRSCIGLMIGSQDFNVVDGYTDNHSSETSFWRDFTSFLIQYLKQNNIEACGLESFRREGLVTALREQLGNRFALIYIEAPEIARAERQQGKFTSLAESFDDIRKRDEEKIFHGATALRELADFVIINDKSEEDFLKTIGKIGRALIEQAPNSGMLR